MPNETTKYIQSVFTLIGGVVFVALMAKVESSEAITALLIGAIGCALLFAVNLWAIYIAAYDSHIMTAESYAETFGKLDDEARAAMGFVFPKMRYVMKRGQLREMFEDTDVPIETFRLFLQTSNEKYISPRRDWYTKEKPEAAWIAIYEYLLERDYIVPDSAAGSYSWLWNGSAYKHLCAYWMAGRRLVDMNAEPERVYAYEEDELTPLPHRE